MLWTIMPEDIVMANSDKISAMQEVTYKNRKVMGYPVGQGKLCIVRIISSDPQDFLDQRFQPGSIIDIGPLS
ncbi:MAG: YlzJ-like family protein [Bacillota bacterium]|nr:YlzJ-like family protein [Bacillota bacterium]